MKICIECQQKLPLNSFSFRKDFQKYRNKCRKCTFLIFKNKRGRVSKVDPLPFIRNFTPETTYILGLIWADGYFNNHIDKRRGTKNQQIILKTQKKDHIHFLKIFKKTGAWSNKYYKAGVTNYGGVKQNHSAYGKCYTSNREIMNFLLENDYRAKSWESADKVLSKIPENLHCYWFLGLFDGDGGYNIHKEGQSISIWSGIKQNWHYLTSKLDKLEINYHKYIKISTKKNQHGSSEIKISNLIDILKFCNYIYNQPKSQKLALPRKMQRYHKLLKRINNFFNLRKESFIIEYKGPLKHNFYYNIQKFGKQIYGKACLTKKEAQEKRDLKFKEVFGEDKFYQYFGPLEKAILTDKYNRENL